MKTILVLPIILLVFVTSCNAQQSTELTEIKNFGANPGNLKMFVHYKPTQNNVPKPLVIAMHGCTQSANNIAELTGWNKLADTNDFVVVYPQQKFINNPNLCFNWFNSNDVNKGRGECESIYQMIQYAREHYNIDTTKIFVTGLSAGALMSVVMMATHPQLINNGAIFAGSAYKVAENPISAAAIMLGTNKISAEELTNKVLNQNPTYTGKYPKVIIYQGLQDPIVNNKNAKIIVNQWAGVHNIDTTADKIEISFMNINDITRKEYHNSNGENIITLYEVNHLGHQLVIQPGNAYNEGGSTGIYGVNKLFHSTYQTAKEFGITKQ